MKKISVITALCLFTGFMYAQTANNQVNFSKSTKGSAASEAAVTIGIGEVNQNANVKIYAYGNAVFVNTFVDFKTSNVEVYNLLGEMVLNTRLNSSNASFTIDNNASSYYIVKVTVDDKTYTKRVYIR